MLRYWPRLVAAGVACIIFEIFIGIRSTIPHARQSWSSLTFGTIVDQSSLEATATLNIALDGAWKEVSLAVFNQRYGHEPLRSCQLSRRLNVPDCLGKEGKLIILAWDHCKKAVLGDTQGENIWCDSLIDALHALGYSILVPDDKPEFYRFWRNYHEQVQIILWNHDDFHGKDCLWNSTCVQADPGAPLAPPNATHLNIPLWKIFDMHFWNSAEHPFGGPFTLSPEDYSTWKTTAHGRNNHYLGYSLERTCLKAPYTPHASRPRQAYVFAKHLKFFIEPEYFLWDALSPKNGEEQVAQSDFYTTLQADANMTFVGRMRHDVPGLDIPAGITELPHMPNRTAFVQALGSSRVLLGVGNPPMSPTPWEALCLGVPFINPIKNWLVERPNDRTQWLAQHDGVFFSGLGEPYVYHVKVGDRTGFKEAIRKAMDTPIDRFIPNQMKMSSLVERTRRLVETDWRPMAKQQLLQIAPGNSPSSLDEDDEES